MSEISVLSNQYKKLVKTSNSINNSVIAIKKRYLLKASKTEDQLRHSVPENDFQEAVSTLLTFLRDLVDLLSEEGNNTVYLPSSILNDYKRKLNDTPYFEEELKQLISELSNQRTLTEVHIQVLDRILAVLDSERTLLFRKLRTARG